MRTPSPVVQQTDCPLVQHMDETVRNRVLANLRKSNINKISDTIDEAQTMLRCVC